MFEAKNAFFLYLNCTCNQFEICYYIYMLHQIELVEENNDGWWYLNIQQTSLVAKE